MDMQTIFDMEKLKDADAIAAQKMYSEMSKRQKLAYIWDYHKTKFFVAVFLVALAGLVYVMSPERGPEANLRVKFVNAYIAGISEETNAMETDYETHLGEDNTCEMEFTYSKISADDETEAGQNMESMMIEVVACNLEVFIFDEFAMNKLCPTGFVLDLNTCLDSDVLEQVKESLVYHTDLEGNVVPMAINITDTEYAKKMDIHGEGVYIAFVANSPNPDIAKEFVTYILTN